MLKPTWRWWIGPDRVIQSIALWMLLAIFGFAAVLLAIVFTDTAQQRWIAVPVSALAACVLTISFAAWLSWMSSAQGGRKFARMLEHAARQRRLPADADASWIPVMARSDGMWSRERYLAPILMGIFAVACAAAVFGEFLGDPRWQAWAGLVLFPLAMIFLPIDAHRKLLGIRLIRAELDERLRASS